MAKNKVDVHNEVTEKLVYVGRCAKVVKGGRRFSFATIIVAGKKGMVDLKEI